MVLSILTLKEGLSPIKLLGIAIIFSSTLGLSLLRGKNEVTQQNKGYGAKNA